MVLLVVAEIKCHSKEKMEEYLEFLKPLLPETAAFDGHINETVNVEESTNTVLLAANWQSKDKFDKYMKFRIESGVLKNTGDFGETKIRFFDSRTEDYDCLRKKRVDL